MPSTYEPIATYTATSSVSTFTFSSIPSTYTDLVVAANLKNDIGVGYNLFMRYNGDTGSNYSCTELYGSGTASGSARSINQTFTQALRNDNSNFSASTVSIHNYANTNVYKTTMSRTGSANNPSVFTSMWRSTAAINSITFVMESNNLVAGSSVTLYGIKAA